MTGAKGAAETDCLVVFVWLVIRWSPVNAATGYVLEPPRDEPVLATATALEAASIATGHMAAFGIVNAHKDRAVLMPTSHRTKRVVAAAAPALTFAARRLAKQAPGVAR